MQVTDKVRQITLDSLDLNEKENNAQTTLPKIRTKKGGKDWQPGQSGNPKGRPKGRSLTSLLKDKMDEIPRGQTKTNGELIIEVLTKRALAGHQWAVTAVVDRLEGKAMQLSRTDITTGGESLNVGVQFVNKLPQVIDIQGTSDSKELTQ